MTVELQLGKVVLNGNPASSGGVDLGNGYRIDTNHPTLKKLATSLLEKGNRGYCVLTTLNNMKRLGISPIPAATGADPNNPRGGMVQMLRPGPEGRHPAGPIGFTPRDRRTQPPMEVVPITLRPMARMPPSTSTSAPPTPMSGSR